MSRRKTVKPEEIGVGFYVAFSCDQVPGGVFFFMVMDHSEQYAEYNVKADPLTVWGLSRYRGNIGYRTLGIPLSDWLARPTNKGAQFRRDRDRTGWPMDEVEDSA